MDAEEYRLMDLTEDSMWWYRALHRRLLARLAGVRGVILDAGCGTGGFLKVLMTERPDLARFGADFDPGAASRASAKGQADVVCASIEQLPYRSGMFDAAVSADVLCHRSVDPARALAELRRVLRPGGVLVLNLPAHEWLTSAHDRRVHTARRFDRRSISQWLKTAGYSLASASYWNSLLLPLMVVQRKLLARAPDASSDVKIYPAWLDRTLLGVTEIERLLPLPYPAGGSIMVSARAP